ncbi:hypothetical protein ABT346_05040 [Micromonospora peucetia]|uniref:hypothetical protein n=1 Tax=Micromonospora peucetia TaxID=47871 RepID=UPI00331C0003
MSTPAIMDRVPPSVHAGNRQAPRARPDQVGRPGPWARILRRYPVSVVVLAPYAILIVPVAVLNDNPGTGFILRLLSVALVGTMLAETVALAGRRRARAGRRDPAVVIGRYPRIYLIARVVTVVGVVAGALGAQAGQGTIFTQLTLEVSTSPVARLAALAAGWPYLAFALLLASFLGGLASRFRVLGWVGVLVAGQAATVALTGITAPAIGYASFVVGAAAIFGLLRPRAIVVLILAVFLVWPSIFAIRNEIRAQGGVAVAQNTNANDRLRLDLQLAEADQYDVPVEVGQPGTADFLRYGLVPRILDPDRPALSTGSRISQYLGSAATSSYSFLALGTVYFLDGWLAVFVFHLGWAALVVLLLRGTPGPVRLSLFCFALGGPLLWSSTYPDSMVAFLQHTISAVPVFAVLWLSRRPVARHAAGRLRMSYTLSRPRLLAGAGPTRSSA